MTILDLKANLGLWNLSSSHIELKNHLGLWNRLGANGQAGISQHVRTLVLPGHGGRIDDWISGGLDVGGFESLCFFFIFVGLWMLGV